VVKRQKRGERVAAKMGGKKETIDAGWKKVRYSTTLEKI